MPLDPKHIHTAHLVILTTAGEHWPSVAAQCTGRIGWEYKFSTHPFMEIYRGTDEVQAQKLCDLHNSIWHPAPVSEGDNQ